MTAPRYLVVDDEPHARARLARLIGLAEPHAVVVQAGDGVEALAAITGAAGGWEAVFLDIEMPGLSGLDVLRRLQPGGPLPPVIFCTAFPRYAVLAFEASACDYLVKPVEAARLRTALARARRAALSRDRLAELERQLQMASGPAAGAPASQRHGLVVKIRQEVRIVPWADILCLRADRKLTCVVTLEGDYLTERSLDELAGELPPELFFRCHRAAVVNGSQVLKLAVGADPVAVLRGGQTVPVSRRRKAALTAWLTDRRPKSG